MQNDLLLDVGLDRHGMVSRRRFLHMGSAALAGSGLLGSMSAHAAQLKKQNRSCVLVWLSGGPSQMETWDPKPGTTNGGQTKAIRTAAGGVQIAQYWPKLARQMKNIAVIRTMTNKEGAHARATYHLHTGRRPTGVLKFPNFGSVVAAQLGDPDADIPNFVSIGNTISSGFLGVQTAPFVVRRAGQLPDNAALSIAQRRLRQRLAMLAQQDDDFARAGASELATEHQALYKQASRMMLSPKLKAFQLTGESAATKAAYGPSQFGQGMLVARRLVEAGVPFIEVRRGGWDNHRKLYTALPRNAAMVDHGLSQLIADLKQRGRLDRTLIVCIGEFGRTPKLNKTGGRDHWPKNFGLLMAGAGVRGGQAIGKTADDGMSVVDRPLVVEDMFQTMCHAMKIDPETQMVTPIGRPLKIVDGGTVIRDVFT